MATRQVGEEAVEFLRDHPDVVLFCRDAVGRPVGYPMRTTAVEHDRVHFTTYRKSVKVSHLEHAPDVAVLCYVANARDRVDWVEAHGRATVWSPEPGEVDRYLAGDDERVPDGMREQVRARLLDGRRVLVRVNLDGAVRRSAG